MVPRSGERGSQGWGRRDVKLERETGEGMTDIRLGWISLCRWALGVALSTNILSGHDVDLW
jgi:hypothetical protein